MLFVDAKSNVDKESLRVFVLGKLQVLLKRATSVIHGESEKQFWSGVHNLSSTIEDEKLKTKLIEVENQVINLDKFIEGWIGSSVESSERFEFFVLTKAEEISGGDQYHDYFWALQIRHDQLIALVEVVEDYMVVLEQLVKQEPEVILESEKLMELGEIGIEERIFVKAKEINEQRKKITGV